MREAWTTIGARLPGIEAGADLHLLVVEVGDVAAAPEAIRDLDLDLRLIEEGMPPHIDQKKNEIHIV